MAPHVDAMWILVAGVSHEDATKITLVGEELVRMQTWELTSACHRQGLSKAAIERQYGAVVCARWFDESVRWYLWLWL